MNSVGRRIKWVVELPRADQQPKMWKFDRFSRQEEDDEMDEATQDKQTIGLAGPRKTTRNLGGTST